MNAHIYDDFYIQCMIILLLSIAVWFIIDLLIDPFKLESE